ncbi:thioredoxin domain-containing protein, partial [Cystoisospora suis]
LSSFFLSPCGSRLNAEKAPFFTSKLNIRCLPSVVLFKNGVAVYTLVGFQALGGVDDFPTSRLEKLLLKHRVATKLPGRELSDNEGGSSEDDE